MRIYLKITVLLATLLIFILVAIITLGSTYLYETMRYSGKKHAVYMGSNMSEQGPLLTNIIQKYILERGETPEAYNLIEPGSGMGYVSAFLAQNYIWKSVIAIEIRPLINAAAHVKNKINRTNKKIQFVRQDLFEFKYPKKSVLYCYVSPGILRQLHSQGIFKDMLVICLTFELEGEDPCAVYSLASWQKQLSVYDFRNLKE